MINKNKFLNLRKHRKIKLIKYFSNKKNFNSTE